jgi:hypothetical protein
VNPFKCYKAKDLKDPKFAQTTVHLVDQFSDENNELKKPFLICNPSDVDGAPVTNLDDHLTCYKIKGNKLAPRPHVEIDNLFGTARLEIKKPFLACVPSDKSVLP